MGIFDPGNVGRKNREYIADLSDKRAAGQLGMTDAQKDSQINRATEAAGAQTQAALSQAAQMGGDPAQQQALFQSAVGGLQNTAAQASANADMASEQQAANRSAELSAQEQALFGRRKEKRDFFTDATGKAVEIAGTAAMACWVAVALWGEHDERTRLARFWCLTHPDNVFVQIYTYYGQTWARWVARSRAARLLAWPIWTLLARLGFRHLIRSCEVERHHG